MKTYFLTGVLFVNRIDSLSGDLFRRKRQDYGLPDGLKHQLRQMGLALIPLTLFLLPHFDIQIPRF